MTQQTKRVVMPTRDELKRYHRDWVDTRACYVDLVAAVREVRLGFLVGVLLGEFAVAWGLRAFLAA